MWCCVLSHLDSLNGSVEINLFSWTAIGRHSNHPADQRQINATCRWYALMCLVIHVYVLYVRLHTPGSGTWQIRRTAGSSVADPPPLEFKPLWLPIKQRSGGGGVRITVGLHVRLLPQPHPDPHSTHHLTLLGMCSVLGSAHYHLDTALTYGLLLEACRSGRQRGERDGGGGQEVKNCYTGAHGCTYG